jgi:hypothetical protein
MNNDKLITDALKSRKNEQLSANFNAMMMVKVNAEAVKIQKRKTALSYLLVAGISILLVALAGYLLKGYLSVEQLKGIGAIFTAPLFSPMFKFGVFIGIIVLLLLIADRQFRLYYERRVKKQSS